MYKVRINHYWIVEYHEEGKLIQLSFLKYQKAKKFFENLTDDIFSEASLKLRAFEDYVICEVTEEEYEN